MIKLDECTNNEFYVSVMKKLSSQNLDRCHFMGVFITFAYSKDVFPKNENLANFTKEVLGIEYKEYVFKVRSTLVSRISRCLYLADDDEVKSIKTNFINYFSYSDVAKEAGRKHNENDKLAKWLKS